MHSFLWYTGWWGYSLAFSPLIFFTWWLSLTLILGLLLMMVRGKPAWANWVTVPVALYFTICWILP
jgi:hypothetical protein